ncbi:MAG: molybdenum cofactor synthesis domain protein [Akkermansiaceae bacterium]|nr:molybdenum cofactor synthesis domain protein [Akkermansiaceae bacterium]
MTLPAPSHCCDPARVNPKLVTPAEAVRLILTALFSAGIEELPLAACLGRVLRDSLLADRPQPPYRRATMDGIALSSATSRGSWRIAGLHAAGDPPPRPLTAGEAWEIMTGAVVPDDCDCLIPYEEISISNGLATSDAALHPGRCIHAAGSDAPAGARLAASGTTIGPVEIAIAASVGRDHLPVSARPVISILTTGDEAVPVTATPQAWQIRRSNGVMLEATLRRAGYTDIRLDHVPDDPAALDTAFDRTLVAGGVVILCGGISRGKRDHVRETVETRLGPPAFHGISQRPGKPMAFWPGRDTPVFALPGNPLSVLATFTRYVMPALRKIEGASPLSLRLPLAAAVEPLPHLTWLLPARLENGAAHRLPPQNSGDFISVAGTTHLLEIPAGSTMLQSGDLVRAFHL